MQGNSAAIRAYSKDVFSGDFSWPWSLGLPFSLTRPLPLFLLSVLAVSYPHSAFCKMAPPISVLFFFFFFASETLLCQRHSFISVFYPQMVSDILNSISATFIPRNCPFSHLTLIFPITRSVSANQSFERTENVVLRNTHLSFCCRWIWYLRAVEISHRNELFILETKWATGQVRSVI